MTSELAELIADADDAEKVEKLLRAASDDKILSSSASSTSGEKLSNWFDRYLARRNDRSPTTRAQYKRTVSDFVNFAENRDVTTPETVTVGLVDDYVDSLHMRYDTDATVLTYTKNVRAWLRWLNKRGLCDDTVYHILDKDELGLIPEARDEALPSSTAENILKGLRSRRRGSPMHAITELLWNGGPRIGGVHSLDRSDFVPEENTLQFRHRPAEGTRLKNGDNKGGRDGERDIEVSDVVVEALNAYLCKRAATVDEYGREPLFATEYGRASRSTLRRWVYQATSCRWSPENEEEQPCDGRCDPDANVCPYSYYPHAIRRGAIVNHLSGGLRPSDASERFDVSVEVLKKHYEPRTERQRKEDRAERVREAW